MDIKHVEKLLEEFEFLEITLRDLIKQNKENIIKMKFIQEEGIEVNSAMIRNIIEEIDKKKEKTSLYLKYLISINIGFLIGLLFAVVFIYD
jgi:FAD synthase